MNDTSTKPQGREKPKAFYSVAELAERWGVSTRTIYREVARGRLRRKHIGGQVRFAAADVESYERQAG
ncbi:MAG: helix-turn-helix domain-containing protein [Isosphaeraceae bacterium]|nr:helix-turn-helix domain-containing protein [Isosphaeraceae bacterium]